MGTIKVNTLNFGEIEVEEDKVITFTQGIPGFEDLHRYTIIDLGEEIPFSYLQSLEEGNMALLVTNPFGFYADYEFQLSEAIKEELDITGQDEVVVICVVSIKDSMTDATVNLLAPLIINRKAALGKQVILHDSQYRTKHKLLPTQAGKSR